MQHFYFSNMNGSVKKFIHELQFLGDGKRAGQLDNPRKINKQEVEYMEFLGVSFLKKQQVEFPGVS